MTIHYGIIGCGMMGQEHLRNIALLEDAAVSVIFEPDRKMAASAAALSPDCRFADSIQELLQHERLDCLLIASPNFCHVRQLEEIAARKALPILVEKPLYTEPEDLARIVRFKDSYKSPVWVGMEYRYMPPMQEFLSRANGATGGVRMLTIMEHRYPFLAKVGNWNRFNKYSGGTFVEKCCHFFDLMRLVLESDPVRIMASAGQEVNHMDEVHDGRIPDIWDCGYVIVDFASGARASLELSMFAEGSEFQEMIHAIGPKGKLEVRIPGPARFRSGAEDTPSIPHLVESKRSSRNPARMDCPVDETILNAGDHTGATYYQHRKFLNVVRGGGKVEVTLDDGVWAVRMGFAAQESAKIGRAVAV